MYPKHGILVGKPVKIEIGLFFKVILIGVFKGVADPIFPSSYVTGKPKMGQKIGVVVTVYFHRSKRVDGD